MTENLEAIRKISNRLATALAVLVVIVCAGGFLAYQVEGVVTAPLAAFAAGVVGGFVGLQRRLKGMSEDDLTLLANSWVYVCLSPLVGGILAVVLYVLFISRLVNGDLFPKFVPDLQVFPDPKCIPDPLVPVHRNIKDFSAIFAVHGEAVDYAKMMFWSFVAGFSERFVTDIINNFERNGSSDGKKGT